MGNNIAPILLIFFNRPDCLNETFESIRKVKPNKLYLFRDGPRNNNKYDEKKIIECEKIVTNIDWPCRVYKNYQIENLGCGKGPYTAINWIFENEDRAIILEDDCVASKSFFPFCSEMLEKYKDDQRIFLITGCNLAIEKNISSSYFFGYSGTNWGWATWKRNWKKIDYDCSFVSNKEEFESLYNFLYLIQKDKGKKEALDFLDTNKRITGGKNISYWDVQWQAIRYLNHQLSIIPKKNLITNIGLGPLSTHAKKTKIPKKEYDEKGKVHFFYNKRYELEFPLVHPKYMIQNVEYDSLIDKAMTPSVIRRFISKIRRFVRVKK